MNDSGGPLILVVAERATLLGVVSWAGKCDGLTVYAKVSRVMDWISEALENSEPMSKSTHGRLLTRFDSYKCYDYFLRRKQKISTMLSSVTEEDCRFAKAPNPFPGRCGKFNASRTPSPPKRRIVNGRTANLGTDCKVWIIKN